jgi:N-formylglutamate deformylase
MQYQIAKIFLKKKSHLPILIIVPHGGCRVPEEFAGYEAVSKFDLLIQSDTCANDLFSFGDYVAGTIDTDISRLFVDLDRQYRSIPPVPDGVIKKSTLHEKPVFRDNMFPDEIAISNVLQRYWFPFHEAIRKIMETGGLRLILDCHTMLAVAPPISRDPGKPRPIILLERIISNGDKSVSTCDTEVAASLMEHLKKSFSGVEGTIAEKFTMAGEPSSGYIHSHYGTGPIPMIRLSLSRTLFLNDTYFSYDYMRVDEIRIRQLRDLLWGAIEKFYLKNFQ